MADLLTVMHDIDAYRGKTCGECFFWKEKRGCRRPCAKGYVTGGPNDGCDDWQPKAEIQQLHAVVMSL